MTRAAVVLFVLCVALAANARKLTDYQMRDKLFMESLGDQAHSLRDLPDMWHTQKLDHFNGTDTRTWKQRYIVNQQHWKKGGPIFLFVEGEGKMNPKHATASSVEWEASLYDATVLLLEHRFYGDSQPLPDWSVKSLQYLSSQQALADAAEFVSWYKANTPGAESSKVIAFGGSYPGNLAAWIRLKYPDVIHGSISTSGPVVAQLDFQEYMEVVQDALGPACSAVLREANKKLISLSNAQLGRYFTGCKLMDKMTADDRLNMYDTLISNIQGLVQYNNYSNPKINTDIACSILMSNKSDPFDGYVRLQHTFMEQSGESCVMNWYGDAVKDLANTKPYPEGAMRQWSWQSCTEFGYFQSAVESNTKQPFLGMLPLKYFTKLMCDDAFGVSNLVPHIDYTNKYYQGRNINSSRIYFVNGSYDPWHRLGVVISPNVLEPTLMIEKGSHCQDLHALADNDTDAIREAHIKIAKRVGEWLSMD